MDIPPNILNFARETHTRWKRISISDIDQASLLFKIIIADIKIISDENLELWLISHLEDFNFGENYIIRLLQVVWTEKQKDYL